MNIKNIIVLFLGLVILQGCSLEHKYAIEFANNTNKRNILVFTPDNLVKTNLKTYVADSICDGNDLNRDSVLIASSYYLAELNDSLLMENYIFGFTKKLKSLGFNVFMSDQITDFLKNDTNNYRVNIVQVELEETLYDYRDEMDIYGDTYYHDHTLNAVYLNSWFEVSKYENNDESERHVYFATDFATDIPDGKFDYDIFSGKVRYMYNIDSLTTEMVYELAYHIGSEYAMYTFDLLLNSELDAKVPENERTNYWRFDVEDGVFYPAKDDRLVPMEK